MALYSISLCAGGAGLDLGLDLACPGAFTPVLYVEREAYAAAVLAARMEDETLAAAPVWSEVRTLGSAEVCDYLREATGGCGPEFVFGGIPCQPHSVAGRQAGANDKRDLWPATADFIAAWPSISLVFIENVPGMLTTGGAERIVRDLETMGYEVAAGLFTAAEVGATQKRNRLFIMASTGSLGRWQGAKEPKTLRAVHQDTRNINFTDRPSNEGLSDFPPGPADLDAWREVLGIDPSLEPAICRMADGMAPRVDRLRMLGNGVVPLQAAYAFLCLWVAMMEKE